MPTEQVVVPPAHSPAWALRRSGSGEPLEVSWAEYQEIVRRASAEDAIELRHAYRKGDIRCEDR